jgi:hypothetical protein
MTAGMGDIGARATRLFKLLAGLPRDERVSPFVFALYVYLTAIAMTLFFAWITGVSTS